MNNWFMWLFLIFLTVSQTGGWMGFMAGRWYLTAEQNLPAWVSASAFAVIALLVTVVAMFPRQRVEQTENRLAVAYANLAGLLGSLVLASLANSYSLDWAALTGVLSALALSNTATASHMGRLKGEIGIDQVLLSFRAQALSFFARGMAGVLSYNLSFTSAAQLFAGDSVSYVPLLCLLLFFRPSKQIPVTADTPLSIGEGVRIVMSNQRLNWLFTISALLSTGTIAFSVVPEVIKDMGCGLQEFSIWLMATGFSACAGTIFGNYLRKRGGYTTGRMMAVYCAALCMFVLTAMQTTFPEMTIFYAGTIFLLSPVESLVEGKQRSVDPSMFGIIDKLRVWQREVLAAITAFIALVVLHRLGLTAREILLCTTLFQLLTALWIWFWLARRRIKLLE